MNIVFSVGRKMSSTSYINYIKVLKQSNLSSYIAKLYSLHESLML